MTQSLDAIPKIFAFEALKCANDGIAIVDMNQKGEPLIFVNPAFEQLSGYKAEEILGVNCRFLQNKLPPQSETEIIRETLKNRKSCKVILKNIKKDGSIFWNELSLAPFVSQDTKDFFYIGIQKDVSSLIHHNQSLIDALELNKHSAIEEARSNLVDSIIQPLCALSIYSKACTLLAFNTEHSEHIKLVDTLNKMDAQVQIIGQMVHTFNNNFNVLLPPQDSININNLVLQLVQTLKFTCEYTVHLDTMPSNPAIRINEKHLLQVILNLVRNSIEAFRSSEIINAQIWINLMQLNEAVEISISDNGPGLLNEFQGRELGTFFSSKPYGIGTGFSLCKKILALYGGSIELEDNKPGLCVRVTLPI